MNPAPPDLPVSDSYTLATAAMSGLSYPQSVVGRGQHHPIVNKTDLGVGAEFFPQSDMADIMSSGGASGSSGGMVNGASPFSAAAAAATSAFSASASSTAAVATSVANSSSSDLKMHPVPKEDSEEDSKAGLLGWMPLENARAFMMAILILAL